MNKVNLPANAVGGGDDGEEITCKMFHDDTMKSFFRRLAFSPDGQWLATGNFDQTIKLWNMETSNLEHTFPGHSAGVNSVAVQAAFDQLLLASDRGARAYSNTDALLVFDDADALFAARVEAMAARMGVVS